MADMQVTFLETPIAGKRIRFTTQNNLNGVTSPLTSVNVDNVGIYTISTQSGSVYTGPLKGTVGKVVDVSVSTTIACTNTAPGIVTIDLKHLNPLEAFLWESQTTNLTQTQIMALINHKNMVVDDHAVFRQIWDAPNRDQLIVCGHTNHNTPEKQDDCLRNQAIKLTVKTLRRYLKLLADHQEWLNNDKTHGYKSYVMWTCMIRAGHTACSVCQSREGEIHPVGITKIDIPHPDCHCEQTFVSQSTYGDEIITNVYEYLKSIDLTRAARYSQNVINSRWKWTPR